MLERSSRPLEVYVPRMLVTWLDASPGAHVHTVDGTMAFVDISGFTQLTERLAKRGRIGAEQMSDILDETFGALLSVASADGAELVKWGGDAVLLLFDGADHAVRACRAASRMRRTLRSLRRPASAPGGALALRMSVGVHSGQFHFFLVGDPGVHRELIVSGPAASVTAEMEAIADAGQIVLSDAAAALVPARHLGERAGRGTLLRTEPRLADLPAHPRTPSAADVGQLLPPPIRTHLGAASGESEHRPVTVAFVQFSGTDALLQDSGPDALSTALDECVRTVQRAAAAHEVTFFESDINRDGGKIMLVAGAPRSLGDDEDRMLRALRQIIENVHSLPVRAGINRGHVFAGDFGPQFRRTYSVKGDAINLAARVMGKAAPGEILATHETVAHARTDFTLDRLEPFMVKGKARPVHAFRVGPVLAERPAVDDDTPFVGREAELARLDEALMCVRAGSGCVVDIVGEPGIGKSRLVAEFCHRAQDVTLVTGRGGAYESTTAYYAFRTVLRGALEHHFGAPRGTDPAVLLQRLSHDVPRLAPWLPLLGIVADQAVPETTQTRELDEQFRRAKLTEVTVDALGVLLDGATVLTVENCHLIDDGSVELLRSVAAAADQRPWVVLTTRRATDDGFRPDPESSATICLPLEPMTAETSMRLLASLRTSGLTRHALASLVDRSGGNPLFLGSLAAAAAGSTSVADLPSSVEGVITAQIDRLAPYDRTVLRYAAVLGMRFLESDLRDLVASRRIDKHAVDRITGFVQRDGSSLQFRHALVRDVAYAGLPFRLRRDLHAEVGRAIETRLVDRAAEAELLSLHFFHAGDHDRAWTYSRLAGERAQARYGYVEAGEFFERAAESAKRAAGVTSADSAAVLERVGDVRTLAGSTQEAIDAYRRARAELRDDPIAAADLLYKQASLLQRLGRFTASLHVLRAGLRGLDGVGGGDAAGVRSKLATRYGFCRYLQGRADDAVRWCTIGVTEGTQGTHETPLAMAYNALHLAHLRVGDRPDRAFAELAYDSYVRLGDLSGQGHSSNTLAIDAHRAGRWGDAEQLFGRAADMFGRIGDIANESNAIYNRCDLLIRQGRFAVAEPLLRDVTETARAVGDKELVALASRELARACSGQGKTAEADELFTVAEALFVELGLRHELVTVDTGRAEAALRAQDPERALELIERATKAARGLSATDALPWLLWLRAGALLDLGSPIEAAQALAQGRTAEAAGEYEQAMMLKTEGRLAQRGGERRPSVLERQAVAILSALGVVAAADPFDCGVSASMAH